jgi:hypothetical protein
MGLKVHATTKGWGGVCNTLRDGLFLFLFSNALGGFVGLRITLLQTKHVFRGVLCAALAPPLVELFLLAPQRGREIFIPSAVTAVASREHIPVESTTEELLLNQRQAVWKRPDSKQYRFCFSTTQQPVGPPLTRTISEASSPLLSAFYVAPPIACMKMKTERNTPS